LLKLFSSETQTKVRSNSVESSITKADIYIDKSRLTQNISERYREQQGVGASVAEVRPDYDR
jgi:hypothetical protein